MNRSEMVERAILKFLSRCYKTKCEDSIAAWTDTITLIGPISPLVQNEEFVQAAKNLCMEGRIRLSKGGAEEYSAQVDDITFFYWGNFKAVLTDLGKAYWDDLVLEQSGHSGFLKKGGSR
jgi:hypothetical protein